MSSERCRSSSPKWIAAAVALMLATVAVGCVGPDAFNRDAGPIQPGVGGNDGFAGQTGSGGSGLGGAAMGGHTGAGGSGVGGATGGVGGKTGTGGSGMGGALGAGGSSAGGRTGSGGSGMGGAPGVGGRGMAGANGMGGAVVTDGGSDGDGAMGMGGAGGGSVVFSDNFESYAIAATQPPTWTRLGGSGGDYQIILDGSQVLTQNRTATGTTYRSCYASGALGAPWSNAATVSAQVKVTAIGTTPTALLCVRYTAGNAGYCLALLPNLGAQIQVRAADVASSSSAVTTMPIAVGTQYNVQISVDPAGVLSGSVNGLVVGPFTPGTAIASGFVGVATQMATATFDNVVVTQP